MLWRMEILKMHMENHVGHVGQQQQTGGAGPKPEKVPQPTLAKGISEDKYLNFHRLWVRYKRSSQLTSEVVVLAVTGLLQ